MIKKRKKTRENLVGKIFGYWTIIEEAGQDKFGHAQWLCLCKCGIKKVVQVDHLRRGKSQSCGCLKLEKITKFSPREASAREVWRQGYKELPFEYFYKLSQQDCHYCGLPPSNKSNTFLNKKNQRANQDLLSIRILDGDFVYNGLDRIDSTKSHTIDNVVPCCKWCNFSKRERTYNDFVDWIKKVFKHLIIEKGNQP